MKGRNFEERVQEEVLKSCQSLGESYNFELFNNCPPVSWRPPLQKEQWKTRAGFSKAQIQQPFLHRKHLGGGAWSRVELDNDKAYIDGHAWIGKKATERIRRKECELGPSFEGMCSFKETSIDRSLDGPGSLRQADSLAMQMDALKASRNDQVMQLTGTSLTENTVNPMVSPPESRDMTRPSVSGSIMQTANDSIHATYKDISNETGEVGLKEGKRISIHMILESEDDAEHMVPKHQTSRRNDRMAQSLGFEGNKIKDLHKTGFSSSEFSTTKHSFRDTQRTNFRDSSDALNTSRGMLIPNWNKVFGAPN